MVEKLKGTKETVNTMVSLYRMIGDKANVSEVLDDDEQLIFALKIDLFKYMSYMASIDGVISSADARCISYVLGGNFSPRRIIELINENDIRTEEFEDKELWSFGVAVHFDSVLYSLGRGENADISEAYLKLLALLTKAIIDANEGLAEDIVDEMVERYEKYIAFLRDYLFENHAAYNKDIAIDETLLHDGEGIAEDERKIKKIIVLYDE